MARKTESGAASADAASNAACAGEGPRVLKVAVAGNPNAGKTTIFNCLTGSHQHVGNYPGVTVEKKEGVCFHAGCRLDVVDLPGTYSLTAYSTDELVARDFLIDECPDVVLCILDASNLERNLYLTVQFIELGLPLVLVLNMSDIAAARGYVIDGARLSALLGGAPVIPAVGNRGQGIREILDAVVAVGTGRVVPRQVPMTYGPEIDAELGRLGAMLEPEGECLAPLRPWWVALKLLEGDSQVRQCVEERCAKAAEILGAVETATRRLRSRLGDDPPMVIADRRYGFISGACQESVRTTVESRHTRSDQIDAVVTHPVLGLPLFLGLMYVVFYATFRVGEYPMRAIEWFFGWLGRTVAGAWPADSAVRSLLTDGIIGGVGGVVVFLPNILILFLAIALLEDSGYMARAAFLTDRWMHKIGLHGKSFIPMVIGFGCTVPAILATRVLESRRDRLTTMLILPLVSCGARLPIYVLLTGALLPERWRAPAMWVVYLVGIVAAVVLAKVLRTTVLRGEADPFVMELPPYRMPTLKGTLIHTWQRGWMYLRKAGTTIMLVSVCLWAMTSYPRPPQSRLEGLSDQARRAAALQHSVAGRIGAALEPITRPLGFDWRVNTALLGALAAKEVFVAQLGIVFALGEDAESLRDALRRQYSPLQGIAMMIFCLMGFPCAATFATLRSESRSWRWAAFQWAGLTAIAYSVTLVVYQAGRILGLGAA